MNIAQEIFLTKRNKVQLVRDNNNEPWCGLEFAATISKNLEAYGYTVTERLFRRIESCSKARAFSFNEDLIANIKKLKGAHRQFTPMYPNFPKQVMEASECELYINTMLHYWSAAIGDLTGSSFTFMPTYKVEPREKLFEDVKLQTIDLGTEEEFYGIFTSLVGSNSSISASDMEILKWFVSHFAVEDFMKQTTGSFKKYLPEVIPQKEILCSLAAWLNISEPIAKYIQTSTDVLRVATALSGGDVSLAEKCKFIKFKRNIRRNLLKCLESIAIKNGVDKLTEDVLRYKERWKRLGEILHPGEYKKIFPLTIIAFDIIRNNRPFKTFSGKIERALILNEIIEAVELLKRQPGVFARRLDHILRIDQQWNSGSFAEIIKNEFKEVAHDAATPLLLQVYHHFATRKVDRVRAFFPKGNVAKVQVCEKPLLDLPISVTSEIAKIIKEILIKRFSKLPSLGSCYLSEELANHLVPFGQRSASKALRTLSRGSRIPLPPGDCVRFFLWWKDGTDRTDIDLSCCFLTENYDFQSAISYYNLRDGWAAHSGDITSAPKGACEFIDVNIPLAASKNRSRYIAMTLNSYTRHPYCELPECFAGWMMRKFPKSGEIFEPKTVQDKIDLTANTTVCIPIILDLVNREMIWTDLALTSMAPINNVQSSRANISKMAKAICKMNRPTLYDLFDMHIEARGTRSTDANSDTVFSLYEGITPFDNDKIKSEFMA